MRRFLMAGYELSNLYNGLVFYQINGIVDCIFENNFKFTKKIRRFPNGLQKFEVCQNFV